MNHIVTRHTLSVLVENAPGVLSQVSRLFSRKGYNIESLAVGTTDDPEVSRITIEVKCDDLMVEQIINQLRKLFSVYSVRLLPPNGAARLSAPRGAGAEVFGKLLHAQRLDCRRHQLRLHTHLS